MKKAELEAKCKALELSLVNSDRLCADLKARWQSQIAETGQANKLVAGARADFCEFLALPWYKRIVRPAWYIK